MLADLALVGFGNVGRRFATLLAERGARLRDDEDLTCRIVGISTRRHGAAWDAAGIDAPAAARAVEQGGSLGEGGGADATAALIAGLARSTADLRVVIETTTLDIRAGQPAIDHVRLALSSGCHAVTANKGPAAFAYEELSRAASASNLAFLFEGAVMDGIPIFNLVRETMPAIDVLGFRGVVNATTNHILSALEDGEAFAPALARMQAEGIAEADPSLDVDGWDAAAKTAALANVLMRAGITPHDVRRTGIGEASAAAAVRARAEGRRLRLVASAGRLPDGSIDAVVAPIALAADDLLAGLRGQANALVLSTDLLGQVAICQLEGSLTQTAYALVSDLVTIARQHRARRAAPPRRTP
jgi:homoserine dehydrogenase